MTQIPRIVYRPRLDTSPQAEVSALAACYRIVLSANGRGRLPDKSGPDDKKERSKDDSLATRNYTE